MAPGRRRKGGPRDDSGRGGARTPSRTADRRRRPGYRRLTAVVIVGGAGVTPRERRRDGPPFEVRERHDQAGRYGEKNIVRAATVQHATDASINSRRIGFVRRPAWGPVAANARTLCRDSITFIFLFIFFSRKSQRASIGRPAGRDVRRRRRRRARNENERARTARNARRNVSRTGGRAHASRERAPRFGRICAFKNNIYKYISTVYTRNIYSVHTNIKTATATTRVNSK